MKNNILVLCLTFWMPLHLVAQESFPLLWKSNFAFNPKLYNFRNPEGTLFFGASDKEVQMLNENGQQLWTEKLSKYGIKKLEYVTWVKAAGVIRLGTEKTKKEAPLSVFVDARTGNELWRTDKITWMGFDGATIDESYIPELNAIYVQYDFTMVMIELKTGKEIWKINTYANLGLKTLECYHPIGMNVIEVIADEAVRSYYDLNTGESVSKITSKYYTKQRSNLSSLILSDEDMHLRLDYKRKTMRGSTGTNTPMTLSAKRFSTGDPLWETKFEANLVTTLVTKKDMLQFFVKNDRVFVVYEGISVFDLKTGKLLWKSAFNNSEVSIGLKAKQELGIADVPLMEEKEAYIADLTSKVQGIRKVDATTGNTIWQTEKFASSDVIPALHLKNGVLLAQFGGVINIQTYIETDQSVRTTNKWKFKGKADIKAFDPATGKLLWDGKKIGLKMDFISTFLFEGNMVYFFTDKEFIGIDIASGQIKNQIDLKDSRLGEPLTSFFIKEGEVVAIMEKGICSMNVKSGTLTYSTKVKEVSGYFQKNGHYFLLVGEDQNDFVGVDVQNGKVLGKFSGGEEEVTPDGKHVIEMKKEKVAKYKAD